MNALYIRRSIILVLASAGSLSAQIPPVPAAFPNVTQVPGKLLYRSPGETNRITNIAYHNGVIYTNMVTGSDRRVWRFLNPTTSASLTQDPTRPNDSIPLLNDHGNHAHTKVGDYMGGYYDIGIRRVSPGVNENSTLPQHSALESGVDSHSLYWPWYLPFHWIQYSGENTPTPTRIYRPNAAATATQLLYEWDSLAEDGVTGNSILLGNLLFITSDESMLGILCYDISPIFQTPAGRPILLDKLTGDFGAYIAAPFENYIILSRGDTRKVEVIDYSDPTDLRHVASIDVEGLPGRTGNTSVSYIQAQDNYVFAQRHKIDMNNFTPVLQLDQVGDNRPAGSVSGVVDTSQYMMPLGNLLLTAGYSFGDPDRLSVWAHQAEPDTRKPYVGYHIPRPQQTNFPLGAPISLLIHETLESFTIINGETVILREAGTTTPLDCWISFSHDDVLTITPKSYLELNKTYEVIIVDGGIKDAVGNGIEPYSFTFSTGSSVNGGNASPILASFTANPSPTVIGETVTFNASATDAENDSLEYRFSFGNNSTPTNWTSASSATHTYTANGHHVAKVQVRDLKPDGSRSTVSKDLTVTIADPFTGTRPTNSSSIAIDSASRRVWSVNPDADTVTVLDADTHAKLAEYNLQTLLTLPASTSVDPRSIAIDAAGRAWVTCHDADRVIVLSPTGSLLQSFATGYGSAPIGVAITPDGTSAFATLTGSGIVKRYSTATLAETGSLAVGPTPRAIAITGDSGRVLVTRYLSDFDRGHVWDINNGSSLSLNRAWILHRDSTPDNASNGRGIPNQLAGITLSPDSRWAWVTGSKMNDQHGLLFAGGRQSTDNTVRALVARLDLTRNDERENSVDRLDVDNSESPTSVVFSPLGDWAFVSLQGNNQVAVYDDLALQSGSSKTTRWRFGTDLAPQGMAIDAATRTLFVNNFMTRSVTTHDLTAFLAQGTRDATTASHPTVATEKLTPTVLLGKQIFYNASLKDSLGFDAMSRDTYISCATCHTDGGTDNRVWDFTQRGEGLRNTTDLRGRSGMGHGNVHWSGNFDEIQDFENDIRDHFGGTGLIEGGDASSPLGTPKTGVSPQLDALAAYVSSLGRETYPKSPERNPSTGAETAAAISGKAVFEAQSCTTCHGGSHFTDSVGGLGVAPLLHDVGTIRTSSGGRLGGVLPGIDTPTLIGIHATAPYFHDGSARTLADVFTVAGGSVYQAESGTLGGSVSRPAYISQNYSNQPRAGGLVSWDGSGTWTLSNVDGGSGGIGALEFLFSLDGTRTLNVNVNGTTYTSSLVGQNPGWQTTHYVPHRIENISLTPGLTNTISINATAGLNLDQVTVSTAADLARAQPHRRVLALGTADKDNLLAYLRQLDGSSVPPPTVTSAPVVANGQIASAAVGAAFSYQILASNSPTSYALSSGSLPAGVTLNTISGLLSGIPSTTGIYTPSFAATNAIGTSPAVAITLTVATSAQTITFESLAAKTVGDPAFNLTATSTSGLTVSYTSSNESVATVSGNTVTIVGAGDSTITASQAGNAAFAAAVSVPQVLTVNPFSESGILLEWTTYAAPNGSANPRTANTIHSNLQASSGILSAGTGFVGSAYDRWDSNMFMADASNPPANLAGAISGNIYATITITPAAGNVYSISNISFYAYDWNNQAATSRAQLVFSDDGFTTYTTLGAALPLAGNGALRSVNTSGIAALQSAATAREFRVYFYGHEQYSDVGLGGDPATASPAFLFEGSAGTPAAPQTGLQSFRSTHGLLANGTQDLLTPAGDGIPNMLKYAFNMIGTGTGQVTSLATPNSVVLAPDGSAGLPLGSLEADTGKLQITYIRRKAAASPAPGITYIVEFSDELSTWGANPSAIENSTRIDDTFERVTITDSIAAPTRRFARVKVKIP